jgi:uncharacterized membrane protein YhaH (DUF805 family)
MIEPIRKYATFSGRAPRREYWWFMLFSVLLVIGLTIVDVAIIGEERMLAYGTGPFTAIASLALLLPSIAVAVRRLHDRDKSGWWLLLAFVPLIGGIILFIWYVLRGTEGPNSYGPDPLARDVAGVFD